MNKLKFLGCGSATNFEFGGNCAYLKHGNKLLLIDCCEDVTKKLIKAKAFDGIDDFTIVITHTHFDHIAGIGVLIWFCIYRLNIKPKIISNSKSFEKTLKKFLELGGVKQHHFEFISQSQFSLGDLTLEMLPTTHVKTLECFGIMFKDKNGQYYYTGDTNDFEFIKKLLKNKNIKTIYCECYESQTNTHIYYNDIKMLDRDKLVLMHFSSANLYKTAIADGFKVADCLKSKIL